MSSTTIPRIEARVGGRFGEIHSVVVALCDRWPNGFFISDIVSMTPLPGDVVERTIFELWRAKILVRTGINLFKLKLN